MRERFEKRKKNKEGFTLVELIVVLVILAVLAGILIPSLTGYIKKAHEKTALLECRQVVLAAQAETSEEYGKGIISISFQLPEIKELSEVPGTVNEIRAVDGKVTYVKYTSTRGLIVIYENGEYKIGGQVDEPGGGEDDNSGTVDFIVGGKTFSAVDAQQYYDSNHDKDDPGVLLPAGAYKVGNEFYYLIAGTSYNGVTQSISGHGVKINLNDKPEAFVYGSGTVKVNIVYSYENKFYVALAGAGIWEKPSSSSGCWGEIFPK